MPDFIKWKDFSPFCERVKALEGYYQNISKDINDIKVNHLHDIGERIGKLELVTTELKDSIIPFIETANATMKSLNTEVSRLKKFRWQFLAVMSVLIFIITFFSDEIKKIFFR